MTPEQGEFPKDHEQPRLTPIEIDPPISGLIITRHRHQGFVIGDLENGDFVRCDLLAFGFMYAIVKLTEVVSHRPWIVAQHHLRITEVYNLKGTAINLSTDYPKDSPGGLPRHGLSFTIQAPKELLILRDELLERSTVPLRRAKMGSDSSNLGQLPIKQPYARS